MLQLNKRQQLRHFLIRSRWRGWLVPVICAVPYLASLAWLVSRHQSWIAQIMLAPIVMTGLLAVLSFTLARFEFRR